MCTTSEKIIDVWKDVLGCGDIDVDASFFDAGGTSMTAIRLINELDGVGVKVDMDTFYRDPTIRMLLKQPDT